ncbi:restriction endonuclease subunit S [Corynebacterium sp. sy017]|uniref:restriction endonuclease subunit S n=1 Tax=unclassified Corynebacterium TaxID=2624378 RepID=UPI00118633B7|nr:MULTISPECIES: restriction endonuclease subunit S [unclassified Corynebacterium]MBP3089120.1 restriction endonuclease subunit S [Corynebacterium sp. sy017]TSD91434.1 restriction endonuclease subunit S [Corynebacterium sp. SY003]
MQELLTDKNHVPTDTTDWNLTRIGDIADFSKGTGLPKSIIGTNKKNKCIHYGELFTDYGARINKIKSTTEWTGKSFSSNNDVLMPTSDVTPHGLAKASALTKPDIILGSDILIMRLSPDKAFAPFIAYLIRHNEQKVLKLVRGSTVYHIYASDLNNLEILLPPLPIQKKIVEILDAADVKIQTLEKQLESTKAIKQGLMQELLTGKTRLPSFSEKWNISTFGNVLQFIRGSSVPHQIKHGSIPLIAAGIKPADYIDTANRKGPVISISSSGANAGYVAWHDSDIWASDCTTVSHAKDITLKYAFYLLKLKQNQIFLSQTGGAQPHVHAKDVSPIEIQYPSEVSEQTKIIEILDAADAKIQALEKQLESTKAIKQGLMQELLSGRTRLTTGDKS